MKNLIFQTIKINISRVLSVLSIVLIVTLLTSCSDDDDENPFAGIRTEGFVLYGTTSTGAIAKYFETIPTGSVDLSDGTDFLEFFPTSLYDHAMYMQRTDGDPGFTKVVVNTNNEFQEQGIIPTNDPTGVISFRIAVRDENTGVYQDRSRSDIITVFDPATLETTAEIDMSAAPQIIDGIDSRFQRFVFRDDEVYMDIRGNINGETYSGYYLQTANLTTATYTSSTGVDAPASGGILTVNNFGQGLVDTNGDLYMADGGAIGTGTFARVYKVPAGSNQIDETYQFSPPFQLAPTNLLYPTMNSFKLVAPGKAIAKVNSFVPQSVIDIIFSYPGTTQDEIFANFLQDQDAVDQVFALLFTAESAAWCELDLIAQTTTVIGGAPPLGANSTGGVIFEHNGEIYFPIATVSEQAFYKYTPGSTTATKAFDVTGVGITGGLNLANNN
ncbi:MAG: hypothetical protein AAGA64_13385 [Bacteroidota bacterium]